MHFLLQRFRKIGIEISKQGVVPESHPCPRALCEQVGGAPVSKEMPENIAPRLRVLALNKELQNWKQGLSRDCRKEPSKPLLCKTGSRQRAVKCTYD